MTAESLAEKKPASGRLLAVAVIGAIGLRIAAASLRGDYLGSEESLYIILGRNILNGQGYTLNGLPNATYPFVISLLAGIVDRFAGPRLALSLPSAVLGGLALIPLYLLASRMASKKVGMATAALYAGYPALLFFSPFVPYAKRLYEGSEQIYLFFVVTAAYFVYRAAQEGRWRDYIVGGIFAGGAFEVRQDAGIWTAAVFVWLVCGAVVLRQWGRIAKSAVFGGMALAAALPFIIHVKAVTGVFGPGLRPACSTAVRDAFVQVIEKDDWSSALSLLTAPDDEGTRINAPYYGVSEWHREGIGLTGTGIKETLGDLRPAYALEAARAFIEQAVPSKLAFAVMLGLAAAAVSQRRWLNISFLATQAVAAAFAAMATLPLARLSMYLAPFAVIVIAWGVMFVFDIIGQYVKRAGAWTTAAGLLAVTGVALYGGYDAIRMQGLYREDNKDIERVTEGLQKQAAEWLFVNTPASAVVMADCPQAAVLAGRQWLLLPSAGEKRTVSYVHDKAPDIVIKTARLQTDRISLLGGNVAAAVSAYSHKARESLVIYDLRGGVKAPSAKLAGPGDFDKFILITIDTVRADHLGCYGYDLPTSPSIDRFAAESTRFARAFSACSFTGPSVTAIHTSRYPGLTESNFANGYPVDPVPAATLAKVFDEEGYQTGAFIGNFVLRSTAGLAEGFRVYDTAFDSAELNRGMQERVASSLTPAAEAWLAAHSKEPFFLWLHYQDPHGPYMPAAPYDGRFAQRTATPVVLDVLKNVTGYRGIPNYQVLGENREVGYYVSQYDGEIAFADEWIGRFLDKVRELGLWDSTVIVLTSDHGEAFGEHEYYCAHGHGIGPELIHVPLVLRIPGRVPSVASVPVTLVDIAPTLARLAGLDVPATFLGRSLLDSLETGKRGGVFFAETAFAIAAFEDDLCYTWGRIAANSSRPENSKISMPELFDFDGAPTGLYDVAGDTAWSNDLQATRPDAVARLKKQCDDHLKKSAKFVGKQGSRELDPETRRTMETIGYVNK